MVNSRARQVTYKPVSVGFGVSTPEQAKQVRESKFLSSTRFHLLLLPSSLTPITICALSKNDSFHAVQRDTKLIH
jgi:hypothetical protein